MSDLVLVDTSAWTRFFRNKPDDPATADEVERLLVEGLACYTQPVYLELVVGARGGRGLEELKENLEALPVLGVGEREWDLAVETAMSLGTKGLWVDMADLLVAAVAITNNTRVLHHDNHFRAIAGVAALREYSFLKDKAE
ncbi:MAG: PIN domain-containing protein [Actinomycetota bacterium]